MKSPLISIGTAILALVLASTPACIDAATSRSVDPAPAAASVNGFQPVGLNAASEADLLTQAYVILSRGDHDYKGHRAKAMRSIEEAAKLLGIKLIGDGKGREQQGLSDAQLRTARSLLEEIIGRPAIKKQDQVVKHVSGAISQIDLALKIR